MHKLLDIGDFYWIINVRLTCRQYLSRWAVARMPSKHVIWDGAHLRYPREEIPAPDVTKNN